MKAVAMGILVVSTSASQSANATVSKPLAPFQALQISNYLTGSMDNNVDAEESTYIKFDACPVLVTDENKIPKFDASYLYLQQIFNDGRTPPRVRLYKVKPVEDSVTIEVYRYLDQSVVFNSETNTGICDQKFWQRVVSLSNVADESCDIPMNWLEAGAYTGSNVESNGCDTRFGPAAGYVTSEVELRADSVFAWDKGYMERDGEFVQIFGFAPNTFTRD